MSLDVSLTATNTTVPQGSGIFVRENGSTKEISWVEWESRFPGQEPVTAVRSDKTVFSANITHNLNVMADEAGVYKHLWRPEELQISKAGQLIVPLGEGLKLLKSDRTRFEGFNPPNGWGDYDGLVKFVENYLNACIKYPDSEIHISR